MTFLITYLHRNAASGSGLCSYSQPEVSKKKMLESKSFSSAIPEMVLCFFISEQFPMKKCTLLELENEAIVRTALAAPFNGKWQQSHLVHAKE